MRIVSGKPEDLTLPFIALHLKVMKGSNRSTSDSSAARLSNSAVLADIAVICFVIFIILIILLHFLRPEYDLRERFISEYAVGAYGFLMTVAFVCLSLGSFVLAIAIIKTRTRRVFYLVSALLFIWSGCILIAAIYPTSLKGAAETTTGHIHDTISLLGFVVIVI